MKKCLSFCLSVIILFIWAGTGNEANGKPTQRKRYIAVSPGTHPSLLFSAQEVEFLRQKTASDELPGEMWQKIKRQAYHWTMNGEWINQGMEITAKALIYQVEGDERAGREALSEMKRILGEIEPHEYYFNEIKSDFFATEHWPKTFAFSYDWLYPLMNKDERIEIVKQLEQWCKALYEHTDSNWWSDASYNCGAIPVGALGLLCLSIQSEATHPEFDLWLESALKRVRDNYYPTSWRSNGICYEGPGYAHYHKNPTMFAEALRRYGGPDIIRNSGAVNAMHYLRFQWMPHGGCTPIGDNTDYGRRVFQPIYLFGIGEINDQAGFHTFLKWTDKERLNPIEAFLFYPMDVKPISAGKQDLPTSFYFEITPNKAGYFFGRSEWDNEDAASFAFVTRYAEANHQHYDMNSFLFTAYGEEFATHANLYAYQDSLHGVDWEHNMVIIDGGGMPGNDAINGAGDDCSLYGYMTGVGTGHFADYVRGDAADSYKDRSMKNSSSAIRADRYGVFVKQGPNPYVIFVDDIKKSKHQVHTYDWLWHCRSLELAGGDGTLDVPLIIPGKKANCAIGFITPNKPEWKFKIVSGEGQGHKAELGRIEVRLTGDRVQYFAVAAAWEKGRPQPKFKHGPKLKGNPKAQSLVVSGEDFMDYIFWQPEEIHEKLGLTCSCGDMITDALLAVVRTDRNGNVIGYLMGDGSKLIFRDRVLVRSTLPLTVSADGKCLYATGKRRAREGLSPLLPEGKVWLIDRQSKVFADGVQIHSSVNQDQVVNITLKQK